MRSVLAILFLWNVALLATIVNAAEEPVKHKKPPYLYLMENPEDVYPIQDYESPNFPVTPGKKFSVTDQNDRPHFFYSSRRQGNRVIMFYGAYCYQSQHFMHHYIDFAKSMYKATKHMDSSQQVAMHAVSCDAHRQFCAAQDVKHYPTTYIIPANSAEAKKVNFWELHPFMLMQEFGMSEESGSEYHNTDDDEIVPISRHERHLQGMNHQRNMQELETDSFLAFEYLLHHGIFHKTAGEELSAAQRKTFLEFIKLLQRTIPPSFSNLRSVVKLIHDDFDNIVKDETTLIELLDQHPPLTSQWSPACTYDGADLDEEITTYKSFSCGFWTLLHMITIGSVEWNQLVTVADSTLLKPHSTAYTILNVIQEFFTCPNEQICNVDDFVKEHQEFCTAKDAKCLRHLVDRPGRYEQWIQVPLWLWTIHNKINIRSVKGAAGDEVLATPEQIQQATWPPKHVCPKCWNDDAMTQQDELMIYRALRLEYWPKDEHSTTFRHLIWDIPIPEHVVPEEETKKHFKSSDANIDHEGYWEPGESKEHYDKQEKLQLGELNNDSWMTKLFKGLLIFAVVSMLFKFKDKLIRFSRRKGFKKHEC